MITSPSFIKNAAAAARYFDKHLSSGDYYESEGKTPGVWFGKAAEELELTGGVRKEDFLALSQNLDPRTGQQLTMRQNTTRGEGEANRRVAMDLCISPPKSVSIQAMVHGDKRIIEAHNRAVLKAAAKLEEKAGARVRKHGMNKSRLTGNAAVAIFQHDTSRAAEAGALPDPQLHSHMIFFNATKDADGSWKALENGEMLRVKSLADALYDQALLQELHAMGYSIREKGKSWELAHIEEATIKKFSKRRTAIEKRTEELKAAGAKRDFHDLKDAVAHDERIRKDTKATGPQLQKGWVEQLDERELNPKIGERNYSISMTPVDSVAWAKEHCFERSAVVLESEIMAAALRHARGSAITEAELIKTINEDKDFLRSKNGSVTTRQVFEIEKYCIDSVRNGSGRYTPLASSLMPSSSGLTPIQRQAAETIIKSKDFAVIFKGGAGTGKSFTLREIEKSLVHAGKDVVILAPQNKQVLGLQVDGFADAKTISAFLSEKESSLTSSSVLIVDEAGQIGGKDMAALIQKAKEAGARVIFSGDTRQHGAVAASDALLAIEKYALTTVAELAGEEAIQRQKVGWYKSAVFAASEGKPHAAFEILDTQGAIVEVENTSDDESARDARVREVARLAVQKEGSSLVVTQTNAEVQALNHAIRSELISEEKLDSRSAMEVPVYTVKEVASSAEKQMSASYDEDTRIIFNRQVGGTGLKPGQVGKFVREGEKGAIEVEVDGKQHTIPREALDRLTLVQEEKLNLCIGDRIQLKANCRLDEKRKLANGELFTFRGLDAEGNIVCAPIDEPATLHTLKDGFKQVRLGYAVTSYSAQGATVDHVIISDSESRQATNTKQFYVSISRGRQSCTILTSDKEALKAHVQQLGERELAVDLVAKLGPFKKAKASTCPAPQPEVTQRVRSFLHTIPCFIEKFISKAGTIFERGAGLVASLSRSRHSEAQKSREIEPER